MYAAVDSRAVSLNLDVSLGQITPPDEIKSKKGEKR